MSKYRSPSEVIMTSSAASRLISEVYAKKNRQGFGEGGGRKTPFSGKLLDFIKFHYFFFTNKCTLHPLPLGKSKHSRCKCNAFLRLHFVYVCNISQKYKIF